MDAYQIRIRDRIVQTSLLTGSAVSAILVANGFAPGQSAQYYTNGADTRTNGVDVVGEYTSDFKQYGLVKWSAGYAWDKTEITHLKSTPTVLQNLGYALFNRQQQGDLTVGTPRDKLVFGGNWLYERFTTDLRLTRYGQYTETGTVASNDRVYGAKWITDLDVAFEASKHVTVAVGANNLFDVYPDKIGIVDAKTGTGAYGSFSPFGITGGFYYARLAYSFD